MDYTTVDDVARALGPGVAFQTDPYAPDVVAASNAWTARKREQAGYADGDLSTLPDVRMGATLYAVALWRERASTDGYQSFEDLAGFEPTGGSWSQIRKLLGIGRAAVDSVPGELVAYRSTRLVRRRWWAR